MESDDLRERYEQLAPRLDKLKQEVIYILEQRVESAGIPIHMIAGRIKSFESLVGKAQRRDVQSPLEEIDDTCGVRVICLFLSDLARLGEAVKGAFRVVCKDDKVASKPEDQFGYLSVHYVCTLPDAFAGPRYDDIKLLRFEVQLRTIAMHAWATISHYLDYKSAQAIPSELRRDFYALSGLFHVADSHFELFFRSSLEARRQAERRIEQGSDLSQEEINLDTLTAFLGRKYPDRKHSDAEAASKLVQEVVAAGYSSLEQVAKDVDKAAKAFEYYEARFPPADTPKYADIGVVRASLSIVNDRYFEARKLGSSGRSLLLEFQEARLKGR